MQETPTIRFSLVLATVGRTEELYRLFDSLTAQTYQNFELIIVDQNDDDRVAEALACYPGKFEVVHLRAEKRGLSLARNMGLDHVNGDLVCFPDDDCSYPADLLQRVSCFFEENIAPIALTGRENNGKWDPDAGPVNRLNLWKRHISFTMFFRESAIKGIRFDESLGVGAGSEWGSGEDADFLLHVMERGQVCYDPSFIVFHPQWAAEPYQEKQRAKGRSYGMGMGHVLRLHEYPLWFVVYHCLRPLAGCLLAFLRCRPGKARYHWAIFAGRAGGWIASAGDGACISANHPHGRILHNTASLYAVQICRKILPLISVPFLARTLGAAGWGRMAFAQAFGDLIVILIEFGFNLSATREVARNRDNADRCRDLIAGVIGAQFVLVVLAITCGLITSAVVPELGTRPMLLVAGILYGLSQGLMPLWCFQGLERMSIAAAIEITGKIGGLLGLFVFVHSPQDDWKALMLQGVAPALSVIAGFVLIYRVFSFRMPTLRLVGEAFRSGWPMFVFRSGLSLYSVGNAFVLGLFAPATQVGYYASSEKISKALSGLLNPIREALYPRLSHLMLHSRSHAAQLARIGSVVSITGGAILSVAAFVTAPMLLQYLMGPQFAPAVPTLRILSFLPLMIAITESAGLQWLLPQGKDGLVNQIVLSGGALNISLALFLAPRYAHIGMAWSVLIAESAVAAATVVAANRSRSMWRMAPNCAAEAMD
jgi:PST family polysaccharide transporter